jgi:hypothetical protein
MLHKSYKMIKCALVIISAFMMIACKKSKEDVTNPEIIIISPEKNAIFTTTDTVEVRVSFNDEDLHNVYVRLEKQEGDAYCCNAIDLKTHSHDLTYNYQRKLVLTDKGNYRLWVKASDHNGNETEIGDHMITVE